MPIITVINFSFGICPSAAVWPRSVEASRGVHGVPPPAEGHAPAHHRVLRAPLPGQILRRGRHLGRALGKTARGTFSFHLTFLAIIIPLRLFKRQEYKIEVSLTWQRQKSETSA